MAGRMKHLAALGQALFVSGVSAVLGWAASVVGAVLVLFSFRSRDREVGSPQATISLDAAIERAAARIRTGTHDLASDEMISMSRAAQIARDMACDGEITVFGRQNHGEALQPIPAEFWVKNQIALTPLLEDPPVARSKRASHGASGEVWHDLRISPSDMRQLRRIASRPGRAPLRR
jgi:hypothetical protein